jgi:hypothetical protein
MQSELEVLDFDDEGVLRVEPRPQPKTVERRERVFRVGVPDLNLPMATGWLTARAA